MNFFSNYRFTLDIQKSKSQASLPVHYGDTGNRFYITLTDGGNPYTIPDGCRVDINIKKPAPHNPIVNACVIENNSLIRYEFNKNTASVEGMHKCELRLYNSDGRLITTPSFVMVVDQRVVYDDEIGTEEDFQRLYAMQVIAEEESRMVAEGVRVDNENARIKAEEDRVAADLKRNKAGYDLIVTSDDEFDQCLYNLYNDEAGLTRDEAILNVTNDGYFNAPNPDFTAKNVLVKGVTFKKMRGYDDVRLHIFQPSIEYINFEDCRWETSWKVSGENPRDPSTTNYNLNSTYTPEEGTGKPRATAFNRATNALHLTVEGIHVTEDNVAAAPVPDGIIGWGIGLRNIKVLRDCNIEYPADYRIPAIGHNTFEITCQFFDFTDTCNVSALWDGMNVSNCVFTKLIKRCHNVSNIKAINLKGADGNDFVPIVDSCSNIVNIRGNISLTNCTNEGATKEYVIEAATTAENNAKEDATKYLPKHTRSDSDLAYGGYRVYGVNENNNQVVVHARTGYNANEIAMRDGNRHLYERPSDYNQTIADYYGSWPKGALMPKDYIDKLVKGDIYGNYGYAPLNESKKIPDDYLPKYAPLVSGKVPEANLPSYVDDVIEGYLESDGHFYLRTGFMGMVANETGKIYVDIRTNKSYRWSGTLFVEISASLALGEGESMAFRGDYGKEAYDHSQITNGNPHGTTLGDMLPVTEEDNGKILQVVGGAWEANDAPEGGVTEEQFQTLNASVKDNTQRIDVAEQGISTISESVDDAETAIGNLQSYFGEQDYVIDKRPLVEKDVFPKSSNLSHAEVLSVGGGRAKVVNLFDADTVLPDLGYSLNNGIYVGYHESSFANKTFFSGDNKVGDYIIYTKIKNSYDTHRALVVEYDVTDNGTLSHNKQTMDISSLAVRTMVLRNALNVKVYGASKTDYYDNDVYIYRFAVLRCDLDVDRYLVDYMPYSTDPFLKPTSFKSLGKNEISLEKLVEDAVGGTVKLKDGIWIYDIRIQESGTSLLIDSTVSHSEGTYTLSVGTRDYFRLYMRVAIAYEDGTEQTVLSTSDMKRYCQTFTAARPFRVRIYNATNPYSNTYGHTEYTISLNKNLGEFTLPSALTSLEGYGCCLGRLYNYIDFEKRQFVKIINRFGLYNGDDNDRFTYQPGGVWKSALPLTDARLPTSNDEFPHIESSSHTVVSTSDIVRGVWGVSLDMDGYVWLRGDFQRGDDWFIYELAEPEIIDISSMLPDGFTTHMQAESGGYVLSETGDRNAKFSDLPNVVKYGDFYQSSVPFYGEGNDIIVSKKPKTLDSAVSKRYMISNAFKDVYLNPTYDINGPMSSAFEPYIEPGVYLIIGNIDLGVSQFGFVHVLNLRGNMLSVQFNPQIKYIYDETDPDVVDGATPETINRLTIIIDDPSYDRDEGYIYFRFIRLSN